MLVDSYNPLVAAEELPGADGNDGVLIFEEDAPIVANCL